MNQKIPKVIHYCWFGRGEKNDLIKKCMETWGKYLPEYEIKEWNEDNFDINSNKYVMQAYENKKWAFVSDYVRLYALYKEGGIYLDTDVEIRRNIDAFLNHSAFTGFESYDCIPTAIMGAEPEQKWIKALLDYYTDKSFIKEDGAFDLTTNVTSITNITKNNAKIEFNNTYQEVKEFDLVLYPTNFFSAPKGINDTNNYSIHHFNGSWLSEDERKYFNRYKHIINYIRHHKTLTNFYRIIKNIFIKG